MKKGKVLSFIIVGLSLFSFININARSSQTNETGRKVLIAPIDGEIDISQAAFIKRVIKVAKSWQADFVIFEIDTPGGRVDAMSMIGTYIDSLGEIPSIAFIRPGKDSSTGGAAFSAGAYIAMSCKRIYMCPGTVIGAATPILISPGGPVELPEPIQEKFVSAYREKFGAVAEKNGYPKNLAIKMVDRDWEISEVIIEGKKHFLTKTEIEQAQLSGKKIDYVSINPALNLGKGKLLTASANLAVECGIAKNIIQSRSEIYKDYGIDNPIEKEEEFTWSENFAGFITQPGIVMLLLFAGILGIWITIKMGGFGTFTVISIICLGLYFFGEYLAGLAEMPEILLFITGIILLILEIFIIPGIGIAAIAGVVCIFAGLILTLLPGGIDLPDFKKEPWQMETLMSAVGKVLLAFVASALGFLAIVRFMPGLPLLSKFVLKTALSTANGYATTVKEGQGIISKHGIVITPLRPAGKIEIEGHTIDVVAEGDFIAKGEEVEVIHVEGTRIVVAKVKKEG